MFLVLVSYYLGISSAWGKEVIGTQAGIWTVRESPYIVNGDVTIPPGKTLTIEPSVLVQFAGYYRIKVNGALIANGKLSERIIFTSVHDKDFGNEQNFTNTQPSNKDWIGIEFAPSSKSTSWLDYCVIRYSDSAIKANFANPTINHTIFADCNFKSFNLGGQIITVQDGIEQDYYTAPDFDNSSALLMLQNTATAQRPVAFAQNTSDMNLPVPDLFKEEEFTFGEIKVVSASKFVQKISEAPAAISVLTKNDIQWTGHTDIADMMRLIPGMDVSVATAGNINLNPRGYNRLYSNRTLVLVDGRTVYHDFFGVIFWPTIPIQLEEIDQIEVIRGPGGSLYGANAYSGVINITTRKPEDIAGIRLIAQGDDVFKSYRCSYIHSKYVGNTGIRFSSGWRKANEFADQTREALNTGAANLLLEQKIGENSRVSFEIGQSKGTEQQLLPWGVYAIPVESEISVASGKVDLELPKWKFSAYTNKINFNALGTTSPFVVHIDNDLYNLSMENFFHLGSRIKFIWGSTYRYQTFAGNVASKLEELGLVSIFGQAEISPLKNISLTIGVRGDQNPAGDVDVPLKTSLMIFPRENHALRLSYGRSYRSASLVETFVVSQFGEAFVLGNENLKSESMEAFELGYRATLFQGQFGFEFNLFQQSLNDFIIFAPVPQGYSFDNFGTSTNVGGELELNFLLTEGVRGRAYYAYQKIDDKESTLFFEKAAPKNKYGLFLGFVHGKWTGYIGAQYIDQFSVVIAPIMEMPSQQSVDEHIIVNAKLGYKVNKNIELSVEGFNVGNNKVKEYPLAEQLQQRYTITTKAYF
jgi:iron complex outermembrane receptor protein